MRPAALLVAAIGCSSGSPSAPRARDGGVDAAAQDAADDACFPFCSGSSSGSSGGDAAGDGAASCAQLAAQLLSLETPARACDPSLPGQCTGAAQGTCCPFTVSAGHDVAVNAYESTVQLYQAQCSPMCMGMCGTAPSMKCDAFTTDGGSGGGACE